MKKSHVIFIILLVTIVLLIGGVTYVVHDRAKRAALNEASDTLFGTKDTAAYVDMNGNPTSLESYLGSVIIVNSWASWSPYAVTELPQLDQLSAEYPADKVVVLAVNRKENRDQAERFISTLPPLSHIKVIVDTNDYFYSAIGGYAMPETVVYNQAGTIVTRIRGTLQIDELRTLTQSLLDENK